MNARDIMRVKLQVLEALGASPALINDYCPSLPTKRDDETLSDEETTYYFNRVKYEVRELLNKPSTPETLGYLIVCELLSTPKMCPYCLANEDHDLEDSCLTCSYGHTYGMCEYPDSLWNIMQGRHLMSNSTGLDMFTEEAKKEIFANVAQIIRLGVTIGKYDIHN